MPVLHAILCCVAKMLSCVAPWRWTPPNTVFFGCASTDIRQLSNIPQQMQQLLQYTCCQTVLSPAVLLTCNMVNEIHLTLPEGRNTQQNQTMALVAGQAELAWRTPAGQLRHLGWYAAQGDVNGVPLDLDYFRRMVRLSCPGDLPHMSMTHLACTR